MRAVFGILAALFALATAAGSAAGPAGPAAADSLAAVVEPLFAANAFDSILTILPRFVALAEARGDSVLLGRAITQRGRVLLMKGESNAAVADIEAGIAIAEAVRDTSGLMPAVHFRGFAYSGVSDWDNAMRCFQRRLDLALRVNSPLDEAWARSGIGYAYHQRGRNDEARREYQRSIRLFQAAGRPRLELNPLIGLGRVESAEGNDPAAIQCFQRAWVVSREVGDRLNEMWATNNLGSLEAATGDPARAAAYQTRAYELARALSYPQGMVVPAVNLARRAVELGDFARADEILRETRALCVAKSDHYYLDIVDYSIADLRLEEGRYPEAADILRPLLTPLDRLDTQHRDVAMLGYARALAAVDSADAAVAWLEQRLHSRDMTYAAGQAQLLLQTASLYAGADRFQQAAALASRAVEVAQRNAQGRWLSTARLHQSIYLRELGRRADALRSLRVAVDGLETFRGNIGEAEWREVYGQEISRDVLDAARILLEYPDSLDAATRTRAFYDALQRFKTRTLLDRISDPRSRGAASGAVGVPATLTTLQGALRTGELVLDFFTGAGRSYLFAVTADSCRMVELPGSASALAERVDLFRRVVASPDPETRAEYPRERIAAYQRALGREVLRGARDVVSRAQRVFVSPDGFYAKVPFGLLTAGDAALVEERDVILIPSASVLVRARSRRSAGCDAASRVVALAGDDKEILPGARDEISTLARRYRAVSVVRGIAGGDSLAGLLRPCDVLHIAAHALVIDRSPWDSGIFLGAPTPARAAAERSAGVSLLSAADSMLVARTFPDDPYLRAWRIADMTIRARLAVLAACETAGGRMTTGEGTLGITAAFLSAGVPVVVASLWPVDDRATERVMTAFYRRLAAGASVARALREAQLEVSQVPGLQHPFFWAGFTVVGEGTASIALDSRPDPAPVLLAGLAVLLVAGFMLHRRRTRARMR